jgi:hypothetical protein
MELSSSSDTASDLLVHGVANNTIIYDKPYISPTCVSTYVNLQKQYEPICAYWAR